MWAFPAVSNSHQQCRECKNKSNYLRNARTKLMQLLQEKRYIRSWGCLLFHYSNHYKYTCPSHAEKLAIQDIHPSSNSVKFNVSCVNEVILTINITTEDYRMLVLCNSTVTINQLLMPSTNYTITGISVNQQGNGTLCLLNQFRTMSNNNGELLLHILSL